MKRITAEQFRANLTGPSGGQEKRRKYGNTKVVIDGFTFDSKHEAECYARLAMLERAGQISDLQLQVAIPLIGAGDRPLVGDNGRPLKYMADFTYRDSTGALIIADAKGMKTRVFQLKKAILRQQRMHVTEM